MRRLREFFKALPILIIAGCAGLTGQQVADRVLADLGCITALAGAGVQVAGDPSVGGAKTAVGVLSAISSVGGSSLPSAVLNACAATLAYANQDAAGASALLKSGSGTPAAPAPAPAPGTPAARAARPAPAQPAAPTVVHVPLK